jgi:hypothetical protein
MADLATRQTDPLYFEAMVCFHSPDDAEEATAALARTGYAFEQTVYDEEDGIHGMITGHIDAGVDERALFLQLIAITDPFGTCDRLRFPRS